MATREAYGVTVGDTFFYFMAKKSVYSPLAATLGWEEGIPEGKTPERMHETSAQRCRISLKLAKASPAGGGPAAYGSGRVYCHPKKLTTALTALLSQTYNSRGIVGAKIPQSVNYG